MSAPAPCEISSRTIFIGVHDRQRHVIAEAEPLHRYPDGDLWAFARCHQAAAEAPEGCVAALKRPMCEECASLLAEDPR